MFSELLLALLVVQPQGELIWSRPDTVGGIYTAQSTDDINRDGHPEVVAVPYYGSYPEPPVTMFCHSGIDGDELWTKGDCQGTWGNKGLAITRDVTGDSIRDIVLGTPGGAAPGSSVFLKSGADGSTLWSWCTYTQGPNWGWVYATQEFTDLTNDGFPEVLAAVGGNSNDRSGTAMCFNGHTGDTVWTFRVPADGAQDVALIADLNADTIPEVAVASGGNSLDNHVYLLDGRTGGQRWGYDLGGSVSTVARIRDVNSSGSDDVIAGAWSNRVACIEGSTGQRIWDVTPSTNIVMEVVPIRDVNGDSIEDVIIGSWASSVYVLSGRDGSTLWSEWVGGDCWSVDTLADVSGDGVPEVVVGALNGKTVRVFNGISHEALWSYSFSERIYDITGAPDLDGDGQADVLVGLQDQGNEANHLFAFKGRPSSGVAEAGQVTNPWSMRQVGRVLEISGPAHQAFSVTLISASGRTIGKGLVGQVLTPPFTLDLDRLAAPRGCCFVRLSSDQGSAVAKLLRVD